MLTSTQNPKIKSLLTLGKSRTRKQSGLFVIEGVKELSLAVASGYRLCDVFYCPGILSDGVIEKIGLGGADLIPISESVFEKIAYRKSTGGIVATAKQRIHSSDAIKLSSKPLVLVIESVEKPGNLGALLRTADASGLDAVILCDSRIDFYNPNVIRSSLGCLFTNQIVTASSDETIQWLKRAGISIYCTYLQEAKQYNKIDFNHPCAIVMGTESTGLSDTWIRNSSQNIKIPMRGQIDSMNVSAAAAVVIFEALRQRGF